MGVVALVDGICALELIRFSQVAPVVLLGERFLDMVPFKTTVWKILELI